MRWIVQTSLRYRYIIVFIAAVLMVFGIARLSNSSVDVFPEFAPPKVEIQTISMNAGAEIASGGTLLFLHADTLLPENADRLIFSGMARTGKKWGRFDVSLSGKHCFFPIIASLMNLRSRITSIATADQAMFLEKRLFEAVHGFPEIDLMEDIAMSKILKRTGKPLCLWHRALTSSRRWEKNGILRTILHMWLNRLAFFLGVHPRHLARYYDAMK